MQGDFALLWMGVGLGLVQECVGWVGLRAGVGLLWPVLG